MQVNARGLQINRLFPQVESMRASLGQIHANAALAASGNSLAALAASANGEVKAFVTEGTISKFILEAMGLNIGSIIVTQLFGDRQVQLNCLASDFAVKDGLMQARTFVVDTEDAIIGVEGSINLASEQLALTIRPESKGVRVISLRAPLYVRGTFRKPDVGVDKGVVALKAGAATLLGTVATPLAALLALINPGPEEDSPCASLLAQARKQAAGPGAGQAAGRQASSAVSPAGTATGPERAQSIHCGTGLPGTFTCPASPTDCQNGSNPIKAENANMSEKQNPAGGDASTQRGTGGELHQTVGGNHEPLTTAQGIPVSDNQNSLRAAPRGPTLLEDFILREKITHFDHERIPERVVHARGTGVHGSFELTQSLAQYTTAKILTEVGAKTPVFARFSTVAGGAGSVDTPRDVRGFAVKFYTREGNWDLVGNNIPVFFIQDAIKFPDVVHSVKMEPDRGFPQSSSAHDTFWDFISLTPESMHMIMWQMSDRTIPRSLRMIEGFGVHSFRLLDAAGKSTFVKFHWRPKLGLQSTRVG